jgi:subtilisin family serine protease/outer membrane protein assembly factor BamB
MMPILFVLLLLVSSVLPQAASANDESFQDRQSEDLELEKGREMDFQAQMNEQEDIELEKGELVDILSGLGWEAPDLEHTDEIGFTEQGKVETAIMEKLEDKEKIDVIIRLKNKSDINKVFLNASGKMSREERVRMVIDNLQQQTQVTQKGLNTAIAELEKKGKAENRQPLWIINGVALTVDKEALKELQKREDIEKITLDRVIEAPEITAENSKPKLPEWGLEKINATKVWGEYGLKGEGIVIGIMDSGVDGNHEALAHNYRGRDGNHQYSWIDVSGQNYSTPKDGYGHGTHVAGTAVGGGAGEPIGVAPDAEWIAAKIFTDGGSATVSGIHRAFEWFMAPGGDPSKAPHLVNNSWGNANTYNLEFYEDVQAWVAAGIFPLFAAGNNGPGSQTLGSPSSFPDSFAIGATDVNDQIASFSSRGPVYWTDEEGNQVRLVKPNVSAPGHQIYSAWPGVRGEGKYNTISGTSMATPHVAGSIALLLQANSDLSINEMKSLLTDTARQEQHMGSLPNDLYGEGIINIYQAVTKAAYAGQLSGTVQTKDNNEVPVTIEIPTEGVRVEKANGPFEMSVREGKHKVVVKAFGYTAYETEVTIVKGETTSVSWTIEPAARYVINGRVADKETKASIVFAYINLKGTPLTARTDASGSFQLTNIPEGVYELVVSGEGIKGVTRQVEAAGSHDLTIEVEQESTSNSSIWATANSSYQRNAVSANAIDVKELNSQWDYVNGTKGQILFSSPSAANEFVVFTTDRGWVTTLDAKSGEEVWSIRLGNSNRSTPTIVEDTIYLSGGQDGSIYALNLENGNIKWSRSIGQPAVYESPLYKDGILMVSSGMADNASVYALNAENGQALWSKTLGGASFFGGALGTDYVYIGSYDNRTIRALEISDGTEVWSRQLTQEGFASRPVYHEGSVYVQSTNFGNGSGTLIAMDGTSGEILWQKAGVGDSQAGSPIVYENLVIAGSSAQPILRAYDKDTGEEVWNNRSVGSTLHNGSVSANGVLFFSGTSGTLQAMDVYSGFVLKDYTLPDYSTSGIVILPGNVIVPHRNGLVSYQSPGTLEGEIFDHNGEIADAKISILETGQSGEIFNDGSYLFKHHPGEFTLKVASYGKKQIIEPVTFVSGYKNLKDFTLAEAEKGGLSIHVKDKRISEALSGVEVSIKETPIKGATDNNGSVQFEEVYEGSYELKLSLNGYKTWTETITIQPGEVFSLEVSMQPFDIAVLNDWEGEVKTLLNANGFLAEERDWDIVEDIFRYEVVYLNGAYGSGGWKPDAALFNELVEKAEEHHVNLVFADSWGANYGTVRQLTEFMQDPKEIAHYNGGGQVRLQVDEEHPIFDGFTKGDRITLFTRTGDFAWFNQHSGRHLASIGSTTQGMKGTGVSYKPVSENSAHLLLVNHGASPWISPLQGWLPDMQTVLFNGLRYLQEAEYGKVVGTVVDSDGNPVQAEVGIVETNVSAKTARDSSDFELYHDEGEYTLEIRASGFTTQTEQIVIHHGSPSEVNIVLSSSNGDKVAGLITDGMSQQPITGAVVNMIKDNEVVAERETAANGRFEITGLEYGSYTLQVIKDGFIQNRQRIEVGRLQDDIKIELYPTPDVAVLGDYSNNSRNFQSLMGDMGVQVTALTISNVVSEVENYDVLFVNEAVNSQFTDSLFKSLLEKADKSGTSLVFGDTYASNAGIGHLVRLREDPQSRSTVINTTSSSGYVMEGEHPLFKNSKAGDFVETAMPAGGRIASFGGYSGYSIASIRHEGDNEVHGTGVAYKPRTANSLELLLSGHGFGTWRHKDHYTQKGKDFLVDAIVWAAYAEFQTISGKVTDEDGEPVDATISVDGEAFSADTDPETGTFSIAIEDGEYDITVESFGYKTMSASVKVGSSSEPLELSLEVAETVGSITGIVENEQDGNAIEEVNVKVLDVPREAYTSTQGSFTITRLLPGTYEFLFSKEGFVEKQLTAQVTENGQVELNVKLKPSPAIGVIVDSTSSGSITMQQYLEGKGYEVVYLFYTDADMLQEVDLVIANSDYDTSKIPTSAEFKAFQKALDETETSIIWTGQHGGRGGIRFMNAYEENPGVILGGTQAGVQGVIMEAHPIVEGIAVEEMFTVANGSNYYYAFNNYDGESIAHLTTSSGERIGDIIGYKGRTNKSVEVLLANFTFGHPYHPGVPQFFDKHRERIFNNAITWALDNQEALIGEMRGTVSNEQDIQVQAAVTVLETGKTIQTNQQGQFYLGLPTGTYTLKIEAFGHLSKEFSVEIENGQQLKEKFELLTDQSGVLRTIVKDGQTEAVMEGATVTVIGTPIAGDTNLEGVFESVLPIDTYSVRVTAPGFASSIQHNVVVEENTEKELTFHLGVSEKIAVVGTSLNGGRIMNLLAQRGYDAEFHANDSLGTLRDNMADYALIIFNDKHSSMTNDQFQSFIELADTNQVSMIFTSQLNNGTIRELSAVFDNPSTVRNDYVSREVQVKVSQSHPIFDGFTSETITILNNGTSSQQYAVYDGYSGTTIGSLFHPDQGELGDGIGYEYRTANSVHVLLSGLHSGTYGHPENRWTEEAKELYFNSIDWAVSASLGEVAGTVTTEDGEPIAGAKVTIEPSGMETTTNASGQYRVGVGTGTYDVKVSARGYEEQVQTVEVLEVGEEVTADFILHKIEGAEIAATVIDKQDNPIANANVTLKALDLSGLAEEGMTNEKGTITFSDLLDGMYELSVETNGYFNKTEKVTVSGEDIVITLALDSIEVAVLGDWNNKLTSFLNQEGLYAEDRGWDLVQDLERYELVVVNTKKGTNEQMEALLEKADEYEVSLVFLGSWADGSIPLYSKVQGYPALDQQGYNESSVKMAVLEAHPIFEGIPTDGEGLIVIHGEHSPYATFKEYPGQLLGKIQVNGDDKGAGAAYEFKGMNHMHLLLSSFAVTNMIGPDGGWTEAGKQLFVQAMRFAMEAEQEIQEPEPVNPPSPPVWGEDRIRRSEKTVTVRGSSEPGSDVHIFQDKDGEKTLLTSVNADGEGFFSSELTLKNGSTFLFAQAENEGGLSEWSERLQVIVTGKP